MQGRPSACPPDPVALGQVLAALGEMAEEHAPAARAWWAARGHTIPAGVSPWLLGVDKVILPVEDPARRYRITPDILAPLIATSAIAYGVGAAWGLERVQWVRPHKADTRWETWAGGTGQMEDYWPSSLLASSETHLRAAWHHAADAAQDYERAYLRRHGRLLSPDLGLPAPALVPALLRAAVRPVGTPVAAAPVACDHPGSQGVHGGCGA